MATRQQFVDAARAYLGVRWMHQGRTRTGVDCIGLVVCALRDVGYDPRDMQGYTRTPVPSQFLGALRANSVPAPRWPLRHGSIGVFTQAGYPCHVGIIATDGPEPTLIQSLLFSRKVVEHRFQDSTFERELIELRDWPHFEE